MKIILFCLLIFTSIVKSQEESTLIKLFKSLPTDYFIDLSESGRDSLLEYGVHIVPGGDSF